MRLNYIAQIRSNIRKSVVINTNRPTTNILDGSYVSVYKGRSMNFDDLREYVPGDDIKDIDWKASARSQQTLVREYIAEKKHNLMFVLDTNRRMLADTQSSQEKRKVALFTAGTLACMVSRNGDYISALYPTEKSVMYFPFKAGLLNVEKILEGYDRAVTPANGSDINDALNYLMRNIRRRMIIVIITDIEGKRSISEAMLKRLTVLHDVLLVSVSDIDASGNDVYDVDSGMVLPDFFTTDKALIQKEKMRKEEIENESAVKLKRAGIVSSEFSDIKDIDMLLGELLARHKLEKR